MASIPAAFGPFDQVVHAPSPAGSSSRTIESRRSVSGNRMAARWAADSARHRHVSAGRTRRQHGFDAFARRHHRAGDPEADGVTQQVAHRLALRVSIGALSEPSGEARSDAVSAGDRALQIGDGGDHRRPGLGRAMIVGPVIAAGWKRRFPVPCKANAALRRYVPGERAADRLRHGEEPPRASDPDPGGVPVASVVAGSGSGRGRLRKRRASS